MTVVTQRIANHLRSAILRGTIGPGERVRQEDIAQQLGASRLPVREALQMLAAEGLIEHEPNKGARVPHLSMHEVDVMYRMREQLEPLALAEAMPWLTAGDIFRLGGQAILEVFHYTAPDQRTEPPRNSDIGGHHVALYVDDLDAAVAHLRGHGVTVLGEPTASRGPHEGQRWVYFLAPWGMQFELVSYPHGRAFFRNESA